MTMTTRKRVLVLAGWLALALHTSASAQDQAQSGEAAALAKTVQNPLANLVSLPFQANYNLNTGNHDRTFFNLNIQPVIPYPGQKWNVITRTIIPVNSVPVGEVDSIFGIGDTNLSLFLSPAKAGALTWGLGPAITIPTASNPEALGSGKLSLGPTGVLFYGVGKWTMGAVASNSWSIAGNRDRDGVNFFFAQWFLNFNLGKGWAIGTAPIVTADWNADPQNRWVVPWGIQVSKVTQFGSRPANVLVGYYQNAEHPDGNADRQVRIQINLLYPQ